MECVWPSGLNGFVFFLLNKSPSSGKGTACIGCMKLKKKCGMMEVESRERKRQRAQAVSEVELEVMVRPRSVGRRVKGKRRVEVELELEAEVETEKEVGGWRLGKMNRWRSR